MRSLLGTLEPYQHQGIHSETSWERPVQLQLFLRLQQIKTHLGVINSSHHGLQVTHTCSQSSIKLKLLQSVHVCVCVFVCVNACAQDVSTHSDWLRVCDVVTCGGC